MSIPHYDKIRLLLSMAGANNGTVFPDYGPMSRVLGVGGDAKTSTVQSQHYGSSGYFDGTGDYLADPADEADWTFLHDGTVPWTFAAWVRPESGGTWRTILDTGGVATTWRGVWLALDSSGALRMAVMRGVSSSPAADVTSAAGAVPNDAWTQVAVDFDGTTLRVCAGTTVVASTTLTSPSSGIPNNKLSVNRAVGLTGEFKGYTNDFTIWKGVSLFGASPYLLDPLTAQISGVVRDDTGALAERRIFAVPRSYPVRTFETTSDDTTGAYTLRVPATECSRIVLDDDAGTLYNDLIDRVIPA